MAIRCFLLNKTRFSWHSAGILRKDYDPCSGGIEYAVLRRCRSEIIAAANGRRPLTLASPFPFRRLFNYFDVQRSRVCRIVARTQELCASHEHRSLCPADSCAGMMGQPEALARFLEKEKSHGHHNSKRRNAGRIRISVPDVPLGSYRKGLLHFTRADSLSLA